MNLVRYAKIAERAVVNNSPLITTAIGVTGVLVTAYLTGKATFKAAELINERNQERDINDLWMDPKEKVRLCWHLYIPAAGTAVITMAAIIFSHHVSTRRAAALASAFALTEKTFAEYKEKVSEKFGEKKEQQVRDELNQERLDQDPVSNRQVIVVNGNVLCYDKLTGRYFTSDIETIRKAVNDTNEQIIHSHYASLGDFFDKIGLPNTNLSEELGWNLDRMLEMKFSTALSDDNRPCIVMEYEVSPARNYFRLG